jgi:hypothetical protein
VRHLKQAVSSPVSSTHAALFLFLILFSHLSCISRSETQAAAMSVRNVPIPVRGEGGGGGGRRGGGGKRSKVRREGVMGEITIENRIVQGRA